MESPKEQMNIIHNMCCREINLLKFNLEKFVHDGGSCQKLLSELNSPERSSNFVGLFVFDRYMTQMVKVLNMARKFNIHLDINSLGRSVINDAPNGTFVLNDFIEWKKSCFGSDISFDHEFSTCAGRIKMTEHISEIIEDNIFDLGKNTTMVNKNHETNIKCITDESNQVTNKIDNLLNFLLPKKDLGDFRSGFEFEACVVYVKDCEKLEFYICLNDDYKTLYNLSRNVSFRPISHDYLPPDDIFCVLDKNDTTAKECVWRAVIVPGGGYKKSDKFMYLVDFGQVIKLEEHCETFEAPLRHRQIPPLAIKCILSGVENSFLKCITYDRDKCRMALLKHAFDKAHFRIVHQNNQILTVVMLEKPRPIETSNGNKKTCQRNPFLIAIFEDDNENLNTNSAALEPPRLLIYKEHSRKEPALNISCEAGNKIQVVVTHVLSPISFYGIIQDDSYADFTNFSWNDRAVLPYQTQVSPPPQLNQIVLAHYPKDGYWYRAKVVNIDSLKGLYKVFYVDFGNTEIVPLSGLAKCSEEQRKDPLRAVLFHLYNLSIIHDEGNMLYSESADFKRAVEHIVVMILEQTINLEVIERRENDLVVRLIDSQYAYIPNMLIDMGIAKET